MYSRPSHVLLCRCCRLALPSSNTKWGNDYPAEVTMKVPFPLFPRPSSGRGCCPKHEDNEGVERQNLHTTVI